ncbi:MAG: S1 RNA-binding domain-containing protein, partial [Clostridia bacterium]|nr:S1 RNA-binding domain-containing protein [Clostridia bacterium]
KKAFEQCAGFLRIPESKNVFDNTGVHPESYDAAKKLIEILGFEKNSKAFDDIEKRLEEYGKSKAAEQCGVGVPTITDIAKELSKPGRDIRDDLPSPIMRSAAMEISDLTPGMEIMGTVRNVIDFGAFVDIGVHQDGLVHISQICSKFIKHPSEVLSVGDIVKVKVLEVDAAKKRISLTMKF